MGDNQQPNQTRQEARHGMNRRQMVHRLVGGVAGGLMVPAVASARPLAAHPEKPAGAPTAAKHEEAGRALLFLDPHQGETLTVLSERVIPGSTEAGVMQFIDLLLSVDTRQNQEKFIASISAVDAAALARFDAPFSRIAAPQQDELLTMLSSPGSGEHPEAAGEPVPPVVSAFQTARPESLLREHFENLKDWIRKAYYSSEVGMKELGWNGTYFFSSFGCEHPG